MMKALTTGLGVLTILAVTGMATPSGQAMLGLRQTQTQTPVSVIADPGPANTTPAAVPTPVSTAPAPASAPAVSHAVAPAAPTAPVARPAVTHAAPVARPAAPTSAPAAAGPVPAASPVNAGAITNILLNLPQVLQPTQGRPGEAGPAPVNNDQWVPPGHRKAKKGQDVQWPDGDPGEQGH